MKNKTGISIFLALVMIVSTFAVVTTTADPNEGTYEIVKEVYNGSAWADEASGYVGDIFEFKITLTYYNVSDPAHAHYGYDIIVNDTLPDCLIYDTDSASPAPTTVSGQYLEWDLGSTKLYDGDSYVITFNATAVALTDQDGEENIACMIGDEHCTGRRDMTDEDDATVIVNEEPEPPVPGISIDKKILDTCTGEWVDDGAEYYVCLYKLIAEDEFVEFEINVTNTGNVELSNVFVTDVLPGFLTYWDSVPTPIAVSLDGHEIVWEIMSLPVDGYVVIYLTARIIPEMLIFDDVLEGENYVNVTGSPMCCECQDDVYDEDSVDVTIWKQLSVEKQVWDGENWVDELDYIIKGDIVKFRFVATYHGCEGTILDCMIAGDLLPTVCLNYTETTYVSVAGQEVYSGTGQYPHIIPDYGDTISICGNDVPIPEVINSPLPFQGDVQVIVWDFRSAEDFDLINGESVIIEFETEAMHYCDCEFINIDFAVGWGCYVCDPCNYYADFGWANVSCQHPPDRFEKTVSLDGENWEESVETFQGNVIHFKLEYEYYADDLVNEIEIKDQLPCILEYVPGSANIEPTNVSEDLKTIWWNLTGEIPDGEPFIITFDAFVEGHTGTCPLCEEVKNKAWIDTWFCYTPVFSGYDEAGISAAVNNEPFVFIHSCAEGEEGETLTFYVEGHDFEGDAISYKINWGDETTSWLGPYAEGVEQTFTHSWDTAGTYTVEAKAKDIHGEEGDWGNEITVVITEAYTLTVDTDGNGAVTVDPDETTYTPGDEVYLTAEADEGWVFDHWTGDLTGDTNPETITMDEDKEITAVFIEEEEEEGLDVAIPMINIGGVSAVLTSSNLDINDMVWNITVGKSGFLGDKVFARDNGTIDLLEDGNDTTINSGKTGMLSFGLFGGYVCVEANSPDLDEPVKVTKQAYIIGPLVIVP